MKHKLALLGAAAVLLGSLGAAAPATATPEHTGAVAAAASCPEPTAGHPEISRGDTGTPVKHAQCILRNGMGYTAVVVDGIFGEITEKAVVSAQKRCEIATDGIVGPNTWACLHKFN
ncbi:peptidoglycan-binding protein [Streptomyces sp. NPDC048581]|uniref:peptidoglycan-binding domain-containing protein n=1 Tax=unclassified Streptomyces TaxID=2593676 RepID=UPI00371B5F85